MPQCLIKRAVLIALSVFFVAQNALANQGEDLVHAAETAQLWEQPYWHKLLHYQESGNGYISLAGGTRLFLSPEGASNPKAELLATLNAFNENRHLEERDESALCAFPARLRWLKEQLPLANQAFPQPVCKKRDLWRDELNPTSATLVFPDAFISSPGSMFGHTLLRVNGAESGARAGLLAYAVNYAANVQGVGAVEYAIKGIAGGFPGFFGVFPYYTKVKEYAWIEHRDLWEYPLNLSDSELTRLLEHLWELREVPFRYFFFDQNCSWQLLALLEVAKPGTDLTSGFDLYAIPVDTVRRLKDAGLVTEEPHLRPSRRRELDATRQQMDRVQRQAVNDLISGAITPENEALASLPSAQQIRIFDTAYELLHIRYRKGHFKRGDALPRAHAMLRARSALGVVTDIEEPQYNVTPPDLAHASTRFGLSAGDDALGSWIGASFRPAFHDLLDPDAGFLPGYGIDFGQIRIRHYVEEEKFRLDQFTLLSATSRSVWTSWSKPSSWNLNIGVERPGWLRGTDADPSLGLNVSGEMGIAFGSSRNHLFLAVASEAHWGQLLGKNGRIATGPKLEAKLSLGSVIAASISVQHSFALTGLDLDNTVSSAAVQWQLNHNNGLRLEALHSNSEIDSADTQAQLRWLHYF